MQASDTAATAAVLKGNNGAGGAHTHTPNDCVTHGVPKLALVQTKS